MTGRIALLVALPTVLTCILSLAVYSGEAEKPTDHAREQFIKDFKRTGLNTTHGDAIFLRILVEASKAKRGIEVGSATGYGAINMGVAFEKNGGTLVTIDIDPKMVQASRENVAKMGLEKTVTCVEGDALKVLSELQGEYDFVFIDARKEDYLKYYKAIESKLKPGALIIADNVIQSAKAMADYLEFVSNPEMFDTAIIQASPEKKDGMAVSYKKK